MKKTVHTKEEHWPRDFDFREEVAEQKEMILPQPKPSEVKDHEHD